LKDSLKTVRLGFTLKGFVYLLLAFLIALPLAGSPSDAIPWEWTGVNKIIAVGDLHGDYGNFVKILIGTKVVDEGLHWIAGRTHLVQTGDIMDRGPDAKGILDLLMRLEQEAEKAGGMVHVLIGNHEELNITGLVFRFPDYVSIPQFTSFLPDAYWQRQEKELAKMIKDLEARGQGAQREELITKFWSKLRNDRRAQREYLVNFNRKYGSWLLKHNAVIKINDIVFVHGGINEKYSRWKIETLNERLRQELAALAKAAENSEPLDNGPLEVAYKPDSPLWLRDLATVPEPDLKEEADRILANLGAKAMVIAHTPRIPTRKEMSRLNGKIWIIDTGISRVYGGRLSALIIKDGDFEIWGEQHEKTNQPEPLRPGRLLYRPLPL
jgi:hypothetical protein